MKNQQRIYIIGICGTFMGGVARLARESGIEVSGSDANTYPPMSTQLESLDIRLYEGYNADNVDINADMIVVGNTISRGNPELEFVLDKGLPYTSGAQWLSEQVLQEKWVIAVAGTHGKTTTSSMLAWMLADNGMQPGYLIGGVPENFGESAQLGNSIFFVMEADEYDTSFSDKRSKFVHYHPRTLVINNLEFDHADIFEDLAAIQTQFNHLIKTIPQSGRIIFNQSNSAVNEVLDMGYWSETESFASNESDWQCEKITKDASEFLVTYKGDAHKVKWSLIGDHNMHNGLAAIAAAHHVGIKIEHAAGSLATFKSVKRRLELIYDENGVHVYDDFAHHPTAITETLNALRNKIDGSDAAEQQRIICVLEPRSNTMKRGVHKNTLGDSLLKSDLSYIYADDKVEWDINELSNETIQTFSDLDLLLKKLLETIRTGDHVIIMSNGSFGDIHQRLIEKISDKN